MAQGGGDGARRKVAARPRACRADRRCRRRGGRARAHAQPAPRADRVPASPIRATRAAFRRGRARRARRIDPRARHHPADPGAHRCAARSMQYEIIAGERRWRAAQRAGLHDVPVVLLEVSDREALELAIIENVQRADLNALEEASGYQALVDEFKYSQDDIAKIVGKSRSHVANTLRLLKLPDGVQALDPRRQAVGRPRARAARPARPGGAGAGDRRAGPERAPGRGDRAGARRQGRQGRQDAPARREGCRHAWRWRSASPMRSAWWSRSRTAARAAS